MEKNEFAHRSKHKMVKPNKEHTLKKFLGVYSEANAPGLFKTFSLISIGNSDVCWQIPLKAILPSLTVGSYGVPTVPLEFDPKLTNCCTKGHQLSDQHVSYRRFSFWKEKNKIKFKNMICHKAFEETASLMCKSELKG
ncbi:hypothetical protein llap_2944 [Limosa lapponica baueri]|uniref:Uncharacterized protein n=1 Tax=Limosa lapponica baueri TaxID=1758121 RepID=A0A2I0UL59_LIMLA|nr:hypothetical protein llap_2944 [Limosa lapponica baueri]